MGNAGLEDRDLRTVRVLRMLSYLSAARRSKSRRELADAMGGISPKSVGRDIDLLMDAGVNVTIEVHGRQQRYRLAEVPTFLRCTTCRRQSE